MARYLALLLICLASAAGAGAWPREPGSWYVSGAVHLSWPQDVTTWTDTAPTGRYDAIYLELGVTRRLTAGLDLGRSVSGASKLVGFFRVPILPAHRRLKLSGELGLGQIDGVSVVRPGLGAGLGWNWGWMAADALLEQPTDGTPPDVKLDMTLGLNLGEGRKGILQLQTGRQAGDPAFARIAPSVVWPLTGRVSVEVGGAYGIAGDTSMGLKLGLWAEF